MQDLSTGDYVDVGDLLTTAHEDVCHRQVDYVHVGVCLHLLVAHNDDQH